MKNNLLDCDKAILFLKERGAQPLSAIAAELKITTEGARFQLLKLANEGMVQATTESKGRGRPQQIWSLTPKGHAGFPDTHAELSAKLIQKMRDTLGNNALQQVIDANTSENIDRYKNKLEQADNLEERVKKLAEMRDQEGYMACFEKDAEGFLLIENHCPICMAATACQELCKAELKTFQTLLGDKVSVERVDHIASGARRCAYRIEENKK